MYALIRQDFWGRISNDRLTNTTEIHRSNDIWELKHMKKENEAKHPWKDPLLGWVKVYAIKLI